MACYSECPLAYIKGVESNSSSLSSSFGEPSTPPSTTSSSVGEEPKESEPPSIPAIHNPRVSHKPQEKQDQHHIYRPKVSRHSLENTRKLRNKRKKQIRKQWSSRKVALKEQLHTTREDLKNEQQTIFKYKCMARSFWDRWRWELLRRKEAHRENLARNVHHKQTATCEPIHHHIDPSHLQDPIYMLDGKSAAKYIGRGSFSVVRVQLYRDVLVAVKELLPHTLQRDVLHEANMLIKLCHPYLPYLFGICINTRPFRIVTQFHGIGLNTVTLYQELQEPNHLLYMQQWVLVTAQLIDALCYLHSDVKIIHNDIKANNVVIACRTQPEAIESTQPSSSQQEQDCESMYHAVLIDFGKATDRESGRSHSLNDLEKLTYSSCHPHIAPEVVHGEYKQSVHSDMFSLGQLLVKIKDRHHYSALPSNSTQKLFAMIEKCRSPHFYSRPSSKECSKVMKKIMNSL